MSDLSGFSMFELFKTEAQSHAAALNDGLLAIESNPADLSHVEQLMRAAHSIKGAARIVDMDVIVELAHAMEDCFVAVQKGTERLTSTRVDQLLAGVDVFQELSQLAESQLDDWLAAQTPRYQQLTASLRQAAPEPPVASRGSEPSRTEPRDEAAAIPSPPPADEVSHGLAEAPAAATTPPVTRPAEAPPPDSLSPATSPPLGEGKTEPPTEQRTVPVNASNLNRIMRLASESMVEARQLQSMQQSLTALREIQRNHSQALERLGKSQSTSERGELDELRTLHRKSETILQDHARRLERACGARSGRQRPSITR